MTAAAACLLLLLVVGACVAACLLNEARKAAEQGRQEVLKNLARAEEAERRRTEQLAASDLEQARGRRFSRQPGQHFQSIEALAEAARSVGGMKLDDDDRAERLRKLRNEAVACLALVDLKPLRRLGDVSVDTHGTGFRQTAAFNPAWEVYARAEPGGPVSVRNLADDRELFQLDRPDGLEGSAYILAFSRDGRYLVAKFFKDETPKAYVVWDVRTRRQAVRQTVSAKITVAPTVDFAFLPDDRHLVLGCRDDRLLTRWDLTTGKETDFFGPGAQPPRTVAVDPDGRWLATADGKSVTLYDARTGAPLGNPWPCPADVWALAWSPAGNLLAVGSGKTIHLIDTAARQTRAVLQGHFEQVVKLAFNPAGTLLASFSWDETTHLWDPADGKELLQVSGDFLGFSPDGRRLAYLKGVELGVWQVADGALRRRLLQPAHLHDVRFSPDGRILAAATYDGTVLWDVPAGRPLDRVAAAMSLEPLFDPSGASLLNVSQSGAKRWPLRLFTGAQGPNQAGPPADVPLPCQSINSAALDAGRKLIVVELWQKAVVLDLDGKAEPVTLRGHDKMAYADISPDGRWAATTTFKGVDVWVWDLSKGRPAASLPGGDRSVARFSLDGQWLVVTGPQHGLSVYRVGSWQRLRQDRLEPGETNLAFTADGLMAVTVQSEHAVRLEDPASGRVWATLPSLRGEQLNYMRFSADGGTLAVSMDRYAELWDLRQLRARLAEMGLD
jgi:WD40 repeat protein